MKIELMLLNGNAKKKSAKKLNEEKKYVYFAYNILDKHQLLWNEATWKWKMNETKWTKIKPKNYVEQMK